MKRKIPYVVVAFAVASIQAATALQAPLPQFKPKAELQKIAQTKPTAKQVGLTEVFYTGKPLDSDREGYLFKYRSYNPDINRWTSVDPSGFPDGANACKYLANPISSFDWMGAFSLSTTNPSSSTAQASDGSQHYANAYDLIHVGAWGDLASTLKELLTSTFGISATLASSDLAGSVTVSNFSIQNENRYGNTNVAAVSLNLAFSSPPTGFAWIQMQHARYTGPEGDFEAWKWDGNMPGPGYSSGPVLVDVPDVGRFSAGKGARELFTAAAVKVDNTWTIYDGIFWGGEVYE